MPTDSSKEPRRLDPSQKQEVAYCIPLWLRDEQIKLALTRTPKRLEPELEQAQTPVAVVCYGPSLNQTWEAIKAFGPHVISCSGSHKFLVERGIHPRYHVEVDPRAHKVDLIGPPHPGTIYLIASACHPRVFDHLEGQDVRLWHIFDSKEEGLRILPAGEWAITGGCSVGLRAMTMAAFLGYRELHIFGMDGNHGPEGSHAAQHPNQASKGACVVEWEGVDYRTTPAMLEAARGTWHELDQMPQVRATFHGEGLVQAMACTYRPKRENRVAIDVGYLKEELISPEYQRLNRQLHQENLAFGVGGGKHAEMVQRILTIPALQGNPSVLDYGCGKGYLAKALGFPIWEYDPAIEGKEQSPRPADLVCCTDVLEHIEPEKLAFVLADLARCVRQVGYFVIHSGPASKVLPDGRNTHLLQHDKLWWMHVLGQFFQVGKIWEQGAEIHVFVGPKRARKRAPKPQPAKAYHD